MEQGCFSVDTLIPKLRKIVDNNLQKYQYGSAVYWAEKLVTLSKGDIQDIYLYAQTLYDTKQYHRAITFLAQKNLIKRSSACRHLAALCHVACLEYAAALEVLETLHSPILPNHRVSGGGGLGYLSASNSGIEMDTEVDFQAPGIPSHKLESSLFLLKGKIHEALDNHLLATECYQQALRLDVMCYEAFEKLVQFQMMTPEEEEKLLSSLDFARQLDPEEAQFVDLIYRNKVQKFVSPDDVEIPEWLDALHDNPDMIVSLAEKQFNACEFQECYSLTSKILKVDSYNSTCLPLHVAVLKELKKSNELFYLAHQLMKLYPKNTISWFAVGCYYFSIGKNEFARRHYMKATKIDRQFGPGWLALGHAFAADKEHDQAIASYCTAAQVMKGCHIPMLYIGIEYGKSNTTSFAERFLAQAHHLCERDPFVLHELATLAFEGERYSEALSLAQRAYDRANELTDNVPSEYWEPLVNNIAQIYRKLGDYEKALEFHEKALSILPNQPGTLSGIGLVLAHLDRPAEAMDYLYRALALKRDDSFATALLNFCVDFVAADRALPPVIDIAIELPSLSGGTEEKGTVPTSLATGNAGHITSDIVRSTLASLPQVAVPVAKPTPVLPPAVTETSLESDVTMDVSMEMD